MAGVSLVMYEAEQKEIQASIEALCGDARGRAVFVVDKNGQLLAGAGQTANIDATSLASLIAGNAAATGGLARVLGEKKEFSVTYNEGDRDNLYLTVVASRVILVVIFSNDSSSLGLVRLRVKKATDALTEIIQRVIYKAEQHANLPSPLAEITDDDIDNLFS